MHSRNRILTSAVFAALSIVYVACRESEKTLDADESPYVRSIRLESKAGIGEDVVSSLDAVAYDAVSGILESYGHSDGNAVSLLLAKSHRLNVCLVANAPEGSVCKFPAIGQFASSVSDFADNAYGGFVMSSGIMEDRPCEDAVCPLSRLACRIHLQTVIPAFVTPELAASGVTLDRVFLINVAGECHYDLSPSGSGWRNRLYPDNSLSPFERESYCTEYGIAIKDASPIDVSASLYCYPNPVDNGVEADTEPDWSPRNTRLVIQLSVDGCPNYYPVTLPAMNCNREYVIEKAVLNGYGTDEPDKAVSRTGMDFAINITPWTTNNIENIEIN